MARPFTASPRHLLALLLATAAGCGVLDADPSNRPPLIESLSVVPIVVAPDGTAVATVQARDPEGAPLDHRWTATAGRLISGADAASAVWQAPATAGPSTLTVTVDDGRSEVAGSVVVAVVPPADDPHLIVAAPERHFGLAGERLPVRLENDGGAVADWTAAFGAGWAAPEPAAGALSPAAVDTLWLVTDRTVPAPGLYAADLTVQAAGDDVRALSFDLIQPWTYAVVAQCPHDPAAFTQGLVWRDGTLFEGTGRYGHSELRRVDLATGAVLQSAALAANRFGEGIAVWQDRIVQLTWLSREAYVRDRDSFASLGTFAYTTQGWGLTQDGSRLIMSDGTSTLYFRDPETFAETGRVTVTLLGVTLNQLNELEWIDGGVWANVWQTDDLVRIDPATGEVTDVADLSGLLTPAEAVAADVLNGIAHDPATGRIWVTGKLWPWLFEIELVDPSGG